MRRGVFVVLLLAIFGLVFVVAPAEHNPNVNGHSDAWAEIQILKNRVSALGGGNATTLSYVNQDNGHGDELAELNDLKPRIDILNGGGINESYLVPIYESWNQYEYEQPGYSTTVSEDYTYTISSGDYVVFYAFSGPIAGSVPVYEYRVHWGSGAYWPSWMDVGHFYSTYNLGSWVDPLPVRNSPLEIVNDGVAFYAFPPDPTNYGVNGSSFIAPYTKDPLIGWKLSAEIPSEHRINYPEWKYMANYLSGGFNAYPA